MKCVVISGPKEMAITNQPNPEPGPGEVRVNITAGGICGSDIHIYEGKHPYVKYPQVIGHEFAGIVDASYGDEMKDKIGKRVAVDPVVTCGECYQCKIGRTNVCSNLAVLGVHKKGGFAEYCCAPASNIYEIPDTISNAEAALVEPFSIAANILNRTGAFENDICVIYGAGPIGLTIMQTLKWVYKVEKLIAIDQIDSRLELAKKCGADTVINGKNTDVVEYLKQKNIKPTLIIDAACHPSILAQATEIAAAAARIGVMGFAAELSGVSQRLLNAKELTIYASRLNNKLFGKVIDWMARGLLKPSLLISHQFTMDEATAAFSTIESNPSACCKVVLSI